MFNLHHHVAKINVILESYSFSSFMKQEQSAFKGSDCQCLVVELRIFLF